MSKFKKDHLKVDEENSDKFNATRDVLEGRFIPSALYSCKYCAEECSLPAEDLFWSTQERGWLCGNCFDSEMSEQRNPIDTLANLMLLLTPQDKTPYKRQAILNALKSYRCQYARGLELVDVVSPPNADDISDGLKELDLIADHICVKLEESKMGIMSDGDVEAEQKGVAVKLWRMDYPVGSIGGVGTSDLFVWAMVHIETGEVDMEVRIYDDDLEELESEWEWMRFRLVPDNEKKIT